MSLHALSDQMETHNVNSPTGWGVDIVYTQRSSNNQTTVKAMVQDAEFREKKELRGDNDVQEDKKVFLSVALSFKPTQGDTIAHDGRSWFVEQYDGAGGIYDIFTTGNARHIGSRSRQ